LICFAIVQIIWSNTMLRGATMRKGGVKNGKFGGTKRLMAPFSFPCLTIMNLRTIKSTVSYGRAALLKWSKKPIASASI